MQQYKAKHSVRARGPVLLSAGFAILLALGPGASSADSIPDALSDGEASLGFRYRLETVDQDGIHETAGASTLRTRLAYQTAKWNGWDGLIEVDNVSYLGDDPFNSTRNGKTSYPVVADPKGTGINQLSVGYRHGNASFRLGRQRLNLDNQRFVGGVGWRQNEQTYDALSASWTPQDTFGADYRYISRVSRVFGPDNGSPADTLDSDSHLVNGSAKLGTATLKGYGYLLDFANAAGFSTRTFGVSYANQWGDSALLIPLHLEFASQSDAGNNPGDYSASYAHANVGAKAAGWSATIGFEMLGADEGAGQAFITPLATLHKFNGWADKFLSTPAGGLRDTYISLAMPAGPGRFAATLHTFDADASSASYGSELDVSFSTPIGSHIDLLVKAARYNEDGFAADTTKIWVMLSAGF